MKKIAKLSLVAAVAVAGLSTTSSAASLEEAIKGVDVSGQFRYRFQEKKTDNETVAAENNNETGSDVEIEVGVKVPVNDNVTAVFKIDNANDDADKAEPSKGNVTVEDYYFQYVNGNATVLAGQQNIPGRLTDGAQGDGIVALYNLGNFTVGAAGFANHNVQIGSSLAEDLADALVAGGATQDAADKAVAGVNNDLASGQVLSVIAMGNVGPVSLLGQYVDVDDTLKAYNVKADASIAMIKAGVEYSETELDGDVVDTVNGIVPAADAIEDDDRSTFKAYVSGKAGIVSAKLSYAATGDNGSGSIDSQVSRDGLEAGSEFLLWNLGTAGNADMDVVALDATVSLTDKLSLRAAYADGEIGNAANNGVEEILAQVTYKMSKNLTTYVRYAEYDASATSDADNQRGRVEVRYSF